MKKMILNLSLSLLILLMVIISAVLAIQSEKIEGVDTVFINEVYNAALRGEYVEGKYDYVYIDGDGNIIYSTLSDERDMSYDSRMNEALKKGYAVKESGDKRIIFYVSNEEYLTKINGYYIVSLATISLLLEAFLIFYNVLFYIRNIRPFKKLEKFALNVSEGNFNKELLFNKNNNFGAFEEAFDIMGSNLKRERERADIAEESKKNLMAEIGHDIKTPLMSIRAISEMGLIKSGDERYRIIIEKTNNIESLVNDIYNATLEEIGELDIKVKRHSASDIYDIIKEVDHNGYVSVKNHESDKYVLYDSFRLTQIFENIIINSYKYADTEIDVITKSDEEYVYIIFKDYGKGIEEKEKRYIMEKFYRGEKVSETNGQGLGLYILRKLIMRMGGDIYVENDNGFKVTVKIKRCE